MKTLKLSDLVIVTTNKNKLQEINEILGTNHKVSNIDIPEIQSLDLDKVITEKAKAAFSIIKAPILVEDVSLKIKSLNNLPGTFVKFFLNTLGAEGTVALINGKDTTTKVTNAIAICDGNSILIFKGSVVGTLTPKNRGKYGFGFDKVFIPKDYKQTYAEMDPSLKNKISHRAKALRKVKNYLEAVT